MNLLTNTLRRNLAVTIIGIVATPSLAGQITGVLTKITTFPSESKVVFQVNGTISGKPACNTSSTFAVGISSDVGRSLLTMANQASAAGSSVTIVGANVCATRTGSEDITSLTVISPSISLINSVAICSSAEAGTKGNSGSCSCATGKYIVPKQITYTTCSITTNTGLGCNARGESSYNRTGECCLCAP